MTSASKTAEAARENTKWAHKTKKNEPKMYKRCAWSCQSSVVFREKSTSILPIGKCDRAVTMRTHIYLKETELTSQRRCTVVPEKNHAVLSETMSTPSGWPS